MVYWDKGWPLLCLYTFSQLFATKPWHLRTFLCTGVYPVNRHTIDNHGTPTAALAKEKRHIYMSPSVQSTEKLIRREVRFDSWWSLLHLNHPVSGSSPKSFEHLTLCWVKWIISYQMTQLISYQLLPALNQPNDASLMMLPLNRVYYMYIPIVGLLHYHSWQVFWVSLCQLAMHMHVMADW